MAVFSGCARAVRTALLYAEGDQHHNAIIRGYDLVDKFQQVHYCYFSSSLQNYLHSPVMHFFLVLSAAAAASTYTNLSPLAEARCEFCFDNIESCAGT